MQADINIKPECVVSSGYDPVKSEETDDEDTYTTTDRSSSHENHLPINKNEEAVKLEVKTEDDVSTDDERSPEYVSSSRYDLVKSEETDNEELDEDTNTLNEQHLSIKVKAQIKTEDVSTDDECGGEKKEPGRPRTSTRSLANSTTQPNSKRNREVEESSESVKKVARIECSVEGCAYKALDSGKCSRHGGYNHCSQDGCTKQVQKGGVCKGHKEFAIFKGPHVICSVEGCNRKATGNGRCRTEHGGYDLCSQDGCTNQAVRGGVCIRHGAKVKTCKHEGCTNRVKSKGVCVKHGASWTKKTCSHDGCSNYAKKGGVCIKHGAKVKIKTCSHEGCTKHIVKGGLCTSHYKLSNGGL